MASYSVRRLEHHDLPTRVAWFNHPMVSSQIMLDAPVSLASTERWFSETLFNSNRLDLAFECSAYDRCQLVAMAGLAPIEHKHRRSEIYIVVDPMRTGQGFGTLALRWIVNYAFRDLDLNRLLLYTMGDNARARRFYERNGFRAEGVLRAHALHRGRLADRHIHALLHSDWQHMPWGAEEGPHIGHTCHEFDIPGEE